MRKGVSSTSPHSRVLTEPGAPTQQPALPSQLYSPEGVSFSAYLCLNPACRQNHPLIDGDLEVQGQKAVRACVCVPVYMCVHVCACVTGAELA